jgi:4,5:9,10-diseco-3-hydroxy-5,9,17-trioxoandrosta-1(10),2-diene-4-oate hydrolase
MVLVGGLRLRCWDEGAGPAVVLIHGIGASLEYWRYTVPALADQHRVLAIDLPGCGFSERGRTLPTLAETADLMVGLLDALGLPRASYVGNSLGGLIALETALRHPGRVERLILSNSAGLGREVNVFWRLAGLPVLGPSLIALSRGLALRRQANIFFDPNDDPAVVERCRSWVARTDLVDTISGAARLGLDLRGQRPDIIRVDRLTELTVPTLLVWGRNDSIIPASHAERAHRLIPNAQLVIFDNCGHCPQLQRPVEFNRVARAFLAGGVGY